MPVTLSFYGFFSANSTSFCQNIQQMRIDAADLPSVDVKSRRSGHFHRFAQCNGSFHMRLGFGLRGAGRDFLSVETDAGGNRRELFVRVLCGNVRLRLVHLRNELPESIVGSASHAIGVLRSLHGPVVHLQREILEHKAGLRFGRDERFNRGLSRLARRTLQVAEFDDHDRRILWAAGWAGHFFVETLLYRFERMRAKRNHVRPRVHACRRAPHRTYLTAGPADWPARPRPPRGRESPMA